MNQELQALLLAFKSNPRPTAKQRGKVHQALRDFTAPIRSHQILVFDRPFFKGSELDCKFVWDCLGWEASTTKATIQLIP